MKFEDLIKNIKTDWKDILLKPKEELKKAEDKINNEIFYPPPELVFNAFNHFNFADLKVVILGQDPYINEGEAMGLAFSVPNGIKIPPSLVNIYKEIKTDLGKESPKSGDLTRWVNQGILLLNSALTVKCGKSNSHQTYWIDYTDKLIKYISDHSKNIVFILWGNNAKSKKKYIDKTKHLILESGHPSPLSYQYFEGNHHFSKCNEYLKKIGKKEIDW